MQNREVHIKVENLKFGYNSTALLDEELNFTVNQGNLMCIVGKNGCGKSTLLQNLIALQKPIAGNIYLNNKLLQKYQPHEKAFYIAYADADRHIFGNFSVIEYLYFGRYPYLSSNLNLTEKDKETIEQTVNYFNIQHLLTKNLHTLSSGEYRIVQIVAAFVQDTPIVILDEPTANLDLDKAVDVFEKLNDLAVKKNKLILVATHQINLAFKYATVILLISNKNYVFEKPLNLAKNNIMHTFMEHKLLKWNEVKMQYEW
jgi:iron complex transport system ATP-binding protein